MAALEAATSVTLQNIDGAIVQSALLNSGDFPPCFTTQPTVKIGGVAATVSYAGFVADSVAGLYQINVQVPPSTSTYHTDYPLNIASPLSGIVSPVQLPVQVTINSVNTQSGVTLWVAPKLNVEAPTVLSGTVGVPWAGSCGTWAIPTPTTGTCAVANPAEGTAPFHYAVTSGVLPAGLSLDPIHGTILGTPGANSAGQYPVTVTATDSAAVPVTGSVSFTLSIAADLYLTSTGSGTFTTTWTNTLNGSNPPATTTNVVTATGVWLLHLRDHAARIAARWHGYQHKRTDRTERRRRRRGRELIR